MISGERRIDPPEREEILAKISEYDIYRYYLGDFVIGSPFCNPLRGEANPSMVVREYNTHLYHTDYGSDWYRGDCFDLVSQKYGCDYNNALLWVQKDFGLSDQAGRTGIVTWKQPEGMSKKPLKLHVVTQRPTQEFLSWWNTYLQDISDLRRENVYCPREIYRNLRKLPMKKTDLIICYYYPEVDKWKIYRPYKTKKTKDTPPEDWKWDTNLDFTHVENLSPLVGAQKGLLTAKKKDRMYLAKLLETDKICNVQAEDPATVNEKTLGVLKEIPNRWGNGDDDEKGHRFTNWLGKEHEFKTIQGDFPDMGRELGHKAVLHHFKLKGFI